MNNFIFFQSSNSHWLGKLELKFSVRHGKSVLTKCKRIGPFVVQKSFYSEADKTIPHIYLLHPSGGLTGGDRLVLDVQLEPYSQALLTTSDAAKFYCTNGLYASQQNIFKLANNSVLEWVPRSSIFFPKTKAIVNTTFILENNAKVIAFEMFCFNSEILNLNCIPDGPEEISIALRIDVPNSVGLQERLKMNMSDYVTKLGNFKISASFFALPSSTQMLYQVRKLIKKELVDDSCHIGGATLLDELLVVKLLGNDNQSLKKLLCSIWSIVRPIIVGKDIVIPRIWYT